MTREEYEKKHKELNDKCNELFPYASHGEGSAVGWEWYADELEGRMLAASFINDKLTFLDVAKQYLYRALLDHTSEEQTVLRERMLELIKNLRI
jgi:hypothetical protein